MRGSSEWICFLLFRFLLPVTFLGATIVRYNGFSLLYGVLMLVEPLLPRPTGVSMSGHTGRYLIVTVVLCSCTLIAQVSFQAFLLIKATATEPYGTLLKNCSTLERSLRQLGLQRLEPNDFGNILRVILPDIGAFTVAVLVLATCYKLLPKIHNTSLRELRNSIIQSKLLDKHGTKIISYLGEFFVVLFLAASGIANPSALSGTYFLVFLATATWWACYKNLGRRFAVVRIILLVYSASHLILIYLYQFQFFQTALPPQSLVARVIGLTAIVQTDCRKPWIVTFNKDATWPMYASPGVIILLYFTLALETRRWCQKLAAEEQEEEELPSTSTTGRPRTVRRQKSASSERQVLAGADTDEALVDNAEEQQHNYQTMGGAEDDTSISPNQDIYGAGDAAAGDTAAGDTASQTDGEAGAEKPRTFLVSMFVYIMRQSYVATLIIMMAWSITYHSWLTFIYLLSACVIWMFPAKRRITLACSPLIVCYAVGLLSIQYVYGFNLKDDELPVETAGGYKYKEIGLVKFDYPCIPLGVQILFTGMFWLTLRQHMRELHVERQEYYEQGLALQRVDSEDPPVTPTDEHLRVIRSSDVVDGYDSDTTKSIGSWIWHMLCKYWIFACAAMFLLMAVHEAVIYRMIYMVLFLYFVIAFQLCNSLWRLGIYAFWWVTIVYSMIVLCCIYTYQFDNFPEYWHNNTGLSYTMLSDLGLETFDTATLFAKLLTPTSFLIVIIIQVHYFQHPFLALSDLARFSREPIPPPIERQETLIDDIDADDQPDGGTGDDAEDDSESSPKISAGSDKIGFKEQLRAFCKIVWAKGYAILNELSVLMWRSLEVHIDKIVMFTIIICALDEVCAMNVVFVIVVIVMMPVRSLHRVMSHVCLCWAALVILAKMTFQLKLVPESAVLTNCTNVTNLPPVEFRKDLPYPFNDTIDNAEYVGLLKTNNLASYLMNYIIIVVILVFESIIRLHQIQYYNHPATTRPQPGIIFGHTKREHADKGLVECVKFFVNFAFYKFGLELCFIISMITMCVRLDGYSVLYGIFLGILLLFNRRQSYHVWPVYIIVLIVLLILQYLSCLGVPAGLCWEYPWDLLPQMTRNLKIYLFLPNYMDPPDPYKLLADFFQLLFVCLQWYMFRLEYGAKEHFDNYGGGSNEDILDRVEGSETNPVEDFLSYKDSYLDYIKAVLFQYSFWVTLVIVFISGTSRISLFCMGYLVGCFFFLWFGQELLLKPLRRLLKLWGILLGYNFFVILMKCCLQLIGCVYISNLANKELCWIVQLFSIVCLRSTSYILNMDDLKAAADCRLDKDEAGLTWDAICFVFLLVQTRIYKSWYFQHVVTELEIQHMLSARGAELINTNLIKSVAAQKSKESSVLGSIKRKMERIRLRQARLLDRVDMESKHHYFVIRSGDYYMFDEDSDTEETESTLDPMDALQADIDKDDAAKPGPLALLNTVITSGTKEALDMAEKPQRKSRLSRHSMSLSDSQQSPPVSPRTSEIPGEEEQKGEKRLSTDGEEVAGPSTQEDEVTDGAGERSPDAKKDCRVSKSSEKDHGISEAKIDEEDERLDEYDMVSPEEAPEQKKDTRCAKFTRSLKVAWAVIGGLIDYVVGILHDISREYRTVSRILDREKEEEKRKRRKDFGIASRDNLEDSGHVTVTELEVRSTRPVDTRMLYLDVGDGEITELREDPSSESALEESIDAQKDAEKEFYSRMPRVLQLIIALFEALMSRSEIVCYFAMILNHLVSASLLSLPYPASVFLWAMLSVPRPSKTYWVTVITYTEAVVVVKYLFQFAFFPWNDEAVHESPFWPPRILGIEKKSAYAAFDLVLLFCLFIHRSVLKRHGLWKDTIDTNADMEKVEEKVQSRATSPAHSPTMEVTHSPLNAIESGSHGEDNVVFESTNSDQHHGMDQSNAHLIASMEGATVSAAAVKKRRKYSPGYWIEKFRCWETCSGPFKTFYKQMTNPKYNAVTDVYAPMFLCDFINFLIVVFGYWAFGPSETTSATETVASVIQENKVPAPFLAMLLAQFLLIIVDRALYLKKEVFGKFLFQIFLVILVHVWMFFILPAITNRAFTANTPAQLWYFTKCVYFGLSAYQIRSGYPTRILGNFLTKRYNYPNLFLFKGFLLIPFLLELRALMDWVWTDTTLALTSWLQMEDIYANIFVLKCWRRAENDYPTPRGKPRTALVKYGQGGLLLLLLIFIIWFPLLLFSLAGAVFQPNPPVDCTVEMKFGTYQPIFTMSAQQEAVYQITNQQFSALQQRYTLDPSATAFLANYKQEDIYVSRINGISTATWDISQPSEKAFSNQLIDDTRDINLYTTISFTRKPQAGLTSETVTAQFTRTLDAMKTELAIRHKLAGLINGTYAEKVNISDVVPRYLIVPVTGTPIPSTSLKDTKGNTTFSDVQYNLKRGDGGDDQTEWWELSEVFYNDPLPKDYIEIYSFNERIAPGALSFLTSYGVIGLYVSLVFVIGQFVRLFFSGTSYKIMLIELPNVDRVLKLCLDIYLVRESKEFYLEEELFSELLFLYRSPDTLIKWTKHKLD